MTLPVYEFDLPREELNCDALNTGGWRGMPLCDVWSVVPV